MLTGRQRKEIRNIKLFKSSWNPEDKFIVPSFFEIKELLLEKLRELGLSKIESVQPYKANCIIRVFQKLDYEYDGKKVCLYGVACFTKKDEMWTSTNSSGFYRINFSECPITVWLFQDENFECKCDFFDCYVRIS